MSRNDANDLVGAQPANTDRGALSSLPELLRLQERYAVLGYQDAAGMGCGPSNSTMARLQHRRQRLEGRNRILYFTAGPNHEADGLFGALQ